MYFCSTIEVVYFSITIWYTFRLLFTLCCAAVEVPTCFPKARTPTACGIHSEEAPHFYLALQASGLHEAMMLRAGVRPTAIRSETGHAPSLRRSFATARTQSPTCNAFFALGHVAACGGKADMQLEVRRGTSRLYSEPLRLRGRSRLHVMHS